MNARLFSRVVFAGLVLAGLLAGASSASAQDISVTFGQGGGLTERVLQLIALLTVLSLAPSILVMVTSFTRIVVVLSLLRTALGTATAPEEPAARPAEGAAKSKSVLDSLEEEMASLLGRPPEKPEKQ